MNPLNHVAIIMDGNGRWGEKQKQGRNFGHLKGVEVVKKIVQTSIKFNIPGTQKDVRLVDKSAVGSS